MAAHNTGIEWTHIPGFKGETWNPVVGCSVISPGCTNCYAMRLAGARLDGNPNTPHYAGTTQPSKAGLVWSGQLAHAPEKAMMAPLRWRKPRAVFVNSMGDLFHEDAPDWWIDLVFAVMALCPQHVFIILTKRSARMRDYLDDPAASGRIWDLADKTACDRALSENHPSGTYLQAGKRNAPAFLPNVWLGVSVEDQARADERIPDLLATPAAVRLVSCEPLLGQVDIAKAMASPAGVQALISAYQAGESRPGGSLNWVIAGGESGKGARPVHPDWIRSLRDQCAAAGVPFFFKQWGHWRPADDLPPSPLKVKAHGVIYPDGRFAPDMDVAHDGGALTFALTKAVAGRTLDGVTHDAFPAGIGEGAR